MVESSTTGSGLSSINHNGRCKDHRYYSARRQPQGVCLTCWRIWIELGIGFRERKLRTLALMSKLHETALREGAKES